ncbi:MAG: leucine-rich repeat protein, partial [Clostridia bacterium]|nr:leucine-rich repeat protein [Clostridia bacterium]
MKKLNRLSAIIALILIAAFILPSTAVIATANDSNLVYFYGDLNANGEIDKFDYIIIKRSCMNTLSLTDEQISRGDVNNDGKIDKFDYILVKRHIMGTYEIPPIETGCDHTYILVVTPPTGTEQGFTTHICEICGYSYIDSYTKPTASEGLAYTVNDDGITCTVTGIGTCSDSELIFPSEIDGYKVTSIGDLAFYRCTNLTSITIPDGVTSIGDDAFDGCTNLKDVYYQGNVENWLSIQFESYASNPCCKGANLYFNDVLVTELVVPDSVTSIGEGEFSGCTSLTSITIPDSVTSIGDYAFYKCTSLTSITIPDSVTSIGKDAFEGCDSLKYNVYDNAYYLGNANNPYIVLAKAISKDITSCTINPNTKFIHSKAFDECKYLTSITIPDGVTSIGDSAFKDCYNLTRITIPDGVTSIGDFAFAYCYNLTRITIPDGVTSIGDLAFYGCTSLTSITIPDGVTSIGDSAFYECEKLTSITVPDSITSIGDDAFRYCTNLTSITIPDSVTSIGDFAFGSCDSLKYNVYDNAYYLGNANNPYVVLLKAISKDITSCTINPNTKFIHSDAFAYCYDITSITIPDSVTSIGYRAFGGCNNLTSVT